MKKVIIANVLLFAGLIAGMLSCDDAGIIKPHTESVWIRLDTSTGEDAYITDYYPATNFGTDPDFAGIAWCIDTNCDTSYTGRTLFRFYLNNIPSTATVTNAKLLLSYNPTCFHSPSPGHRNNAGSNACLLQRITANWSDSNVTWSNQPTAVTNDEISVPASTSQIENYTIDITAFINDMVKNPATNYGLMLRTETELPLGSLNFASSDNIDSTLRPLLLIDYTP